MSLPYMKMYWGDYLGDTYHLRAIEHGGYLLMIAHYWRAGCLPDDPDKLARIARMSRKEWDRYGETIMQFFPDGKHKRIDEERNKAETKSEVNKLSAKKRWDSVNDTRSLETLTEDYANAYQTQSDGNANHSHSHNHNQLNKKKENPKERKSRSASSAEFDQFWNCYPKKVGRGAAEKAWLKAIAVTTAEEITRVVQAYPWGDDKQFIPHPATWLNQRRWQDDFTTTKAVVTKPSMDNPAALRKYWATVARERPLTEAERTEANEAHHRQMEIENGLELRRSREQLGQGGDGPDDRHP